MICIKLRNPSSHQVLSKSVLRPLFKAIEISQTYVESVTTLEYNDVNQGTDGQMMQIQFYFLTFE